MHINEGIIEQLAAGSQEAFHTVYKVAYPQVRAFSKGLVKNDADADDITQLVFIKLWTNHSRLSEVDHLDAYIFTIAKNTVLSQIAQRHLQQVGIDQLHETDGSGATPQEQIEAADLKLLIDMVVEQMPSQRQAVYRMSREEGLSNDEIAQRLGIQKKTVENHLNLALGDIREMLKILILWFSIWGHNLFIMSK